jgi:hypothetical protein
MSKENSEIALQQVEALNRRDVDAYIALVSPDVEWEDAVSGRSLCGSTEGERSSESGLTESWSPGKASISRSRR